ncbi:hypothetical protein [Burkholderia sp. Ac-20349]|uniref:hypothetical protein n=1 Tax=Burkholderia sp. Ac-20349 TaxID=2703893 RepID=UPI00197C6AD3|nr:hypothetical protein [Burkholderia sp. Ac-20349]MBN3839313.1 hypothetical protein [Burkholderia sp. Ac-20349]
MTKQAHYVVSNDNEPGFLCYGTGINDGRPKFIPSLRHAAPFDTHEDAVVAAERANLVCYTIVSPNMAPAVDPEHVEGQRVAIDFGTWWETTGRLLRAGGGEYEKTFAYCAWIDRGEQLPFETKIGGPLTVRVDVQAWRDGIEMPSNLTCTVHDSHGTFDAVVRVLADVPRDVAKLKLEAKPV